MPDIEMPDADDLGGNVTKPFKFVTAGYDARFPNQNQYVESPSWRKKKRRKSQPIMQPASNQDRFPGPNIAGKTTSITTSVFSPRVKTLNPADRYARTGVSRE
ncbi:hypothetical protein LTR84_008670 [Exophiala bonariae]|uniref:Uncharacterized protein n=1 Tax=Exophiala bonariae TaxID=1690606 RepID=A0AAV9MZR6_9EURO|nr:hypothetical protein LTR84_008670 [Exophiala bonariae]